MSFLSKGGSCLLGLDCWFEVYLVLRGEVFYDFGEGLAEKSGDDSLVVLSSSNAILFCRKLF